MSGRDYGRNIEEFPFPPAATRQDREEAGLRFIRITQEPNPKDAEDAEDAEDVEVAVLLLVHA